MFWWLLFHFISRELHCVLVEEIRKIHITHETGVLINLVAIHKRFAVLMFTTPIWLNTQR